MAELPDPLVVITDRLSGRVERIEVSSDWAPLPKPVPTTWPQRLLQRFVRWLVGMETQP